MGGVDWTTFEPLLEKLFYAAICANLNFLY